MKRSFLAFILLSMIMEPGISQLGTTHKSGSRKGWSIGVEGSYGKSSIENNSLTAQALEFEDYTWESTPGYGMSAGINGYYFFNEYFGIRTGIVYNNYKSTFLLNGIFLENELSKDINDDSYYKVREAEYTSDIDFHYISVPLLANFTLGKPGKNGLFVEGGALIEQKLIATSHLSGSFDFYGYYPQHPQVTQILKISELGFYSIDDIDKMQDVTTSFYNISGYVSFGLNLAFGYLNTVRIGAELIYGTRKMDYGYDYELSIHKKYSIKISYILKL